MIDVIQPGLYTTIQDRGRFGYYGLGFPPSGSMDHYSSSAANLLVGNSLDAPVIESTFVGPTLEFQTDSVLAVTGAEATVTLDGDPLPLWTSVSVSEGQQLAFAGVTGGARNYIAVRGGFNANVVMGSASTYVASHLGGVDGRVLHSGDQLTAGNQTEARVVVGRDVPSPLRPEFRPEQTIRIVEGLCHYLLSDESKLALVTDAFTVSTEANRIGYRLSGNPLTFVEREQPFGAGSDPSNVVNLGYPVGSLQSPSGAELICLMRDAVTGGGYATLATVISADLDVLAQMKFPEEVRFEVVTLEQALEIRQTRLQHLDTIREAVSE